MLSPARETGLMEDPWDPVPIFLNSALRSLDVPMVRLQSRALI